MGKRAFYTSFNGRTTAYDFRVNCCLHGVIAGLVAFALNYIISLMPPGYFFVFIAPIFLAASSAVTCRRLHDLNCSGWWQLVNYCVLFAAFFLTPLDGGMSLLDNLQFALSCIMLFFVILSVLPGTRGSNRYGPDSIVVITESQHQERRHHAMKLYKVAGHLLVLAIYGGMAFISFIYFVMACGFDSCVRHFDLPYVFGALTLASFLFFLVLAIKKLFIWNIKPEQSDTSNNREIVAILTPIYGGMAFIAFICFVMACGLKSCIPDLYLPYVVYGLTLACFLFCLALIIEKMFKSEQSCISDILAVLGILTAIARKIVFGVYVILLLTATILVARSFELREVTSEAVFILMILFGFVSLSLYFIIPRMISKSKSNMANDKGAALQWSKIDPWKILK